MDRKYWETIAPKYETEIFDVLQNDKSGSIIAAIEAMASPEKSIMDIGCAVGKWIPILSPKFKLVIAADISANGKLTYENRHTLFNNTDYTLIKNNDDYFSNNPLQPYNYTLAMKDRNI